MNDKDKTMEHFIAWIITHEHWLTLTRDFCEVVVMRYEIGGFGVDGEDDEIPVWTFKIPVWTFKIPVWTFAGGDALFSASLTVRHDDPASDAHIRAIDEATSLLEKAGWIVRPGEWKEPTSGYTTTVYRDERSGD